MDLNLVILSLEYTYLISSLVGLFETNTGLWQSHLSQTLIPYSVRNEHKSSVRIIDNMDALRQCILKLNHNGTGEANHIKLIEPQLNNQLFTVSITGNETFINNCRTELLKAYLHVNYKRLVLSDAEFAAASPDFVHRLESIAAQCNVEISITNQEMDYKNPAKPCESASIYIVGNTDNLSRAETETRILVDTLLNNCYVDRIQVPLSILPGLGGVNMANFTEIARQLNVNIYLPYLLPQVFNTGSMDSNGQSSIWVTAKRMPEIVLTKKIIADLLKTVDPRLDTETAVFVQKIEFAKDKLDVISLYNQAEILNIMFQRGTFVQMPTLGEAGNNTVVIQGHSADAVQETAMELTSLSSQLYTVDMKFSKGPTSVDFEYYLINLINLKKTCVLTYNEHGLEIMGSKEDIRLLLSELVSNLQSSFYFTKLVNESDTKFQIVMSMELSNHQKDFLSGKKNGKIIKILNQLGHIPSIRFRYLNDYNFEINTSISIGLGVKNKQILSIFELLIKSVLLIEMELPAEMQFNVPDVFHKSIIGNGGSIIQSIMKKYNVFIKFSSTAHKKRTEEKHDDRILYLFTRNNNVLIKCPMKNLKNILFVKYEIDQMVTQCCQNILPLNGISAVYNSAGFRLLKSHYLMLIRENKYDVRFISDLEAEFNTFIEFPTSLHDFKGQSSMTISITGNDTKPQQCAQKLASMLPKCHEFQITYCPGRFDELINEQNTEFREKVMIPFRLLQGVEVMCDYQAESAEVVHHKIIVSSYDDQKAQRALVDLTHYLREKSFLILDKQRFGFDPVIPQTHIASRSPTKSPTKSPVKSRNRSPTKSPQKQNALKTITNKPAQNLKKIPVFAMPSLVPWPQ